MKQNYLFAPVIILLVFILSFLSANVLGQSATNTNKKVKVRKHVECESNDSVKVIVKTIQLNDSSEIHNVDSIIQELLVLHKGNNNQQVKVIQVIKNDSAITTIISDSIDSNYCGKNELKSAKQIELEILDHMSFIVDSCFDMKDDSLFNPMKFIHKELLSDDRMVNIQEIIDAELSEHNIKEHINMTIDDFDNELILINDDGENIRIERKGEMVFINKEHELKDIDSLLEFEENEEGDKVIVVKTRIVLDELSKEDKDGLKTQGLKSGKKEPDFSFIKFYPNPTTDGIHVNFKLSEPGNTEVKVVDMLGKTIFEEKLRNFDGEYSRNIRLKEHGNGPFILQIIQGKKVVSRKILIE